MASIFDTIADMLRGSSPDDLAHALGTDRTQTRRAMEIGLPALITGLRDKTLEPGGAQSLAALLVDEDAALPDNVDNYLSSGDPSRGAAMLDVAFGDRGEPALAALSSASGLNTRLLAQVMSVLAPLATGVLRQQAPGDPDGLRSYLAGAVDDLEGKGFGRVVELVSPELPAGGGVALDVVDADGPAALDVVVSEDGAGTVVTGAFPEADLGVASDRDFDFGGSGDDVVVGIGGIGGGGVGVGGGSVGSGGGGTAAVEVPGIDSLPPEPPYPSDSIDETYYAGDETPIVDPKVDYDDGQGLSAMGWLWWLVGAVLAVLLLFFLLSRCTGDDEVATTGDDADAATQPQPTATPDTLQIERQNTLNQILVDYPGVTGTMVGEVAVLEGTVADQTTKALLDKAVRDAGIGPQNNVQVSGTEAPAPDGYSLNDLIEAQPELSTLRALLDQAGLASALDGNGPFTLFAPTNDAFAAIQTELATIQSDPDLLSSYLQYHLLSGEQSGGTVAQVETLQSISGELIDVSVVDGQVRLNDFVPILVADRPGRNGVMHIVNGVLVPPSQVPVPAELGEALALNPITFAAGSSDLTDAGRTELDKVVAFLLATPVSVEIGGHTDGDGDEALNQGISEDRANAVREYLTSNGVPADSLTAVGYGETQPVAPNDTAENKAKNRRIEFVTTG